MGTVSDKIKKVKLAFKIQKRLRFFQFKDKVNSSHKIRNSDIAQAAEGSWKKLVKWKYTRIKTQNTRQKEWRSRVYNLP